MDFGYGFPKSGQYQKPMVLGTIAGFPFGKKPVQGNLVEISYRVSTGKAGNNGKVFVNSGSIDGHSNIAVTTVTNSIGGQEMESINDIKFSRLN